MYATGSGQVAEPPNRFTGLKNIAFYVHTDDQEIIKYPMQLCLLGGSRAVLRHTKYIPLMGRSNLTHRVGGW